MLKQLAQKQQKLAKRLILCDKLPKRIRTIAGLDCALAGKHKIIAAAVVCDYESLKPLEAATAVFQTSFPYLPGFLSFREGPALILVLCKLKSLPDVLLIDGNGILHKRRFGLASHVGLLLGRCSIGVAKSLLCGEIRDSRIYYRGRLVGYKLHNLYISPGHKISLQTAVKIVKKSILAHRLPEPLFLAHAAARRLKRKLM
jgi:deoxyribonuclease V